MFYDVVDSLEEQAMEDIIQVDIIFWKFKQVELSVQGGTINLPSFSDIF